ncbi:MAG: AI-2E family transporter [Caulobacter sp.]|nr:AI-2E family transporter [Caulobacter sp.]
MTDSPDRTLSSARLALALLATVSLVFLVWRLAHVALIAFAAVIVAVLLRALADPLSRRARLPEGAALVVSGLVIVAVLAASSWLFGATVVGQLNGLAARLPSDEAQLRTLLERLPFGAALSDFSFNAGTLAGGVQGVAGRVGGYALNAFSALTNTALVLVAGVYLALKPAAAREGLLLLVPESRTSTMRAVLDTAGRALRLWLLGTFADMAVVAVMTGAGTALIGLPSPVALGILAGVASFVPIVGPIVSVVPALLIAVQESPSMVLWTVLVYVAVQQIESNLIFPFIQRRAVDLPPVLSLFGVLAFGVLLGPLGVVLATPLLVVGLVFLKRLYVRESLGKAVKIPGEISEGKTTP